MSSRAKHLFLAIAAIAAPYIGGEAEGAFLPPEFETVETASTSGSSAVDEIPLRSPKSAVEVEWPQVALLSSSGMSGSGGPSPSSGGAPSSASVAFASHFEPTCVVSRRHLSVERVVPCTGFLPEIMRPPRV